MVAIQLITKVKNILKDATCFSEKILNCGDGCVGVYCYILGKSEQANPL